MQFLDLWSWRIFLGQATKLYILKSWSFKVASVFWFDAFLNMLSAIWWIYEKTERGKYFLSNGNFFLTSKWCQKSMNWKTMFKIAIRFKFYALWFQLVVFTFHLLILVQAVYFISNIFMKLIVRFWSPFQIILQSL